MTIQEQTRRQRVPDRFVDAKGAMERLGVGRSKLYELINEGRLPKFKLYGGRRTVFKPDDIEKLINETVEVRLAARPCASRPPHRGNPRV